jgi:hypothetical protein
VVQPKLSVFKKREPKYLFGKIRDHVNMNVQLWYVLPIILMGTQFHPEADPISFVSHLRNKEKEKKKR